ncbi:hypothetical protein J6590_036944 [Homalodisca vitripennis]|nr:hypothetical protein J6590_036944 [Homalodisca vitripennis]
MQENSGILIYDQVWPYALTGLAPFTCLRHAILNERRRRQSMHQKLLCMKYRVATEREVVDGYIKSDTIAMAGLGMYKN